MRFTRQTISVQSIVLFILIAFSAPTARAKSVYAIIYHQNDIIGAYKIDANQIEYQTEIQAPQHGYRAIDLAIDSGSSCIFVTYEDSNIIEIINAKTMEYEGSVTATGATNLAGIVFDEAKQKLYTVNRGTYNLFVYFWNPNTKTLTPDGINPKILTDLPTPPDAHGIALDTTNNHLYVANRTNIVHYYDTNGWGHVNDVNVGEIAVDVDIDSGRGYLYGGGYTYHDYLLKLDLSTGIAESNDIGAGVIGLAVDPNSGLVYTTTFHNQLRVYDTSTSPFTLTDYEDIIKGCGVCVPSADISYKPPVFDVNKVDNVNDVDCVYPFDPNDENYLVYTICYDANGYADTNVVITDYLPVEVEYYSSDPCGVYHPDSNTVIWDINDISGADSNCLQLTVKVNYYAKPGHKIKNYCEMEGDEYCTFTTLYTNVCCYGGDIIYVDQDANDPNSYHNGTSWLDAYTDLQEALHTARKCGCEQIRVAEGTYKPTKESDRSISFELLDDVAVYGGFPPGGGTWFERNPSTYETILSGDIATPNDLSDNSYHVVKCQDVNNAILDGFTITAGNADAYYPDEPNQCGGGIYCKDSNHLTVANCIIIENEAGVNGGGIYFKDSTNLTLTDCDISDNSAYCGGALYNESSETNINNCFFSGNLAMAGGGMYNHYEPSPTVANCTFNGNTVYWSGHSTYGGGICNDQSSPTLINCTFNDNSAPPLGVYTYGGAIYNKNSSDPNVSNCTFSNNSAYDGGGICNWNDSNANVNNCTFSNNSAYEGGGVCNYDSDPNITNCIFNGNTAVYNGGGICSSSSEPNITNCIFTGNTTDYYGGAIFNWNYSNPNVTNCTFSNNSAREGGAVYNYIYSDPNITNCIFTGNTAIYYGGGMVNSNVSSPTITNCIFSGNSATTVGNSHGGAICNWNCSDPNITNCTFSNNSAYEGGGVYNNLSDPNITNCIFWDNEATVEDEIYKDASSFPEVSYSDIKGGWAGTGNIDEDPCFFSVEQSTSSWTENASYDESTFQSTLTDADANWAVNELAGKFVNPDIYQVYQQFFIVSNDVNTIKVWSDVESIAGDGDTYQIYDYHLKLESYCIDAGTNTPSGGLPATDIDGEPRVMGDCNEIVDMGADEVYFPNCWNCDTQCHGDSDCDGNVNSTDFFALKDSWMQDYGDPNYNPCADFNRDGSVNTADFFILKDHWMEEPNPNCPCCGEDPNCTWPPDQGEGGRGGGEQKSKSQSYTDADIEEIIKWLEELWLTNEEVRKMISEDEWLKFIESVANSK